jgi:hypothetical protein
MQAVINPSKVIASQTLTTPDTTAPTLRAPLNLRALREVSFLWSGTFLVCDSVVASSSLIC